MEGYVMNIRKNITISRELAYWYEKQSKNMGVSQSALMVIALDFYREYKESMSHVPDLITLLSKVND